MKGLKSSPFSLLHDRVICITPAKSVEERASVLIILHKDWLIHFILSGWVNSLVRFCFSSAALMTCSAHPRSQPLLWTVTNHYQAMSPTECRIQGRKSMSSNGSLHQPKYMKLHAWWWRDRSGTKDLQDEGEGGMEAVLKSEAWCDWTAGIWGWTELWTTEIVTKIEKSIEKIAFSICFYLKQHVECVLNKQLFGHLKIPCVCLEDS